MWVGGGEEGRVSALALASGMEGNGTEWNIGLYCIVRDEIQYIVR